MFCVEYRIRKAPHERDINIKRGKPVPGPITSTARRALQEIVHVNNNTDHDSPAGGTPEVQ